MKPKNIFRLLLCLVGILLILPLLELIALAFTLPVSISGIGYLLAGSLTVAGLILAPRGGKQPVLLTLTGMSLAALIAGMRVVLAQSNGTSTFTIVTLPQGKETCCLSALIDEQDSLIFGETIFHFIGGDSPREHENITAALYRSYTKIRESQQVFPSPVLSTYLNLQQPDSFDALIIEPEVSRHPETAIIFLHGYMGNVSAQCWEIAQAVEKFGAVTVCPSTDWTGQWWHPEGEAILRDTFQYLRKQGIEKFYLGGFSNGGFGVSLLISKVSKEDGLAGLFFIDGISDGTSIRATGFPVLVIQAAQDERVPVAGVRQIVEDIGEQAAYVELNGDHFIIIKQPEPVQNAIESWLENH